MTTAEMIQEVRDLVRYNLDLYRGPNSTDAQIVGTLNKAQERLGTLAALFDPAVALTLPSVTGPCVLDLDQVAARRVFEVHEVVIGGRALLSTRGARSGPWSLVDLEQAYPSWRSDAQGVTARWTRLGDSSIVLHPAPDLGTRNEGGNYVSGFVLPKPLDASTPSVSSELILSLHQHLANLAASIEAGVNAKDPEQFVVIKAWRDEAFAAAEEVGKANRAAVASLATLTARGSDYVSV